MKKSGVMEKNVVLDLNGNSYELLGEPTVTHLLGELGLLQSPVAVEVNTHLVTSDLHDDHVLVDGDKVEVVTLVGGG